MSAKTGGSVSLLIQKAIYLVMIKNMNLRNASEHKSEAEKPPRGRGGFMYQNVELILDGFGFVL